MDFGYFSRTNTSTLLNKQTFFFSHNLKSEKKSSIIVQFAECLLHLRENKQIRQTSQKNICQLFATVLLLPQIIKQIQSYRNSF